MFDFAPLYKVHPCKVAFRHPEIHKAQLEYFKSKIVDHSKIQSFGNNREWNRHYKRDGAEVNGQVLLAPSFGTHVNFSAPVCRGILYGHH